MTADCTTPAGGSNVTLSVRAVEAPARLALVISAALTDAASDGAQGSPPAWPYATRYVLPAVSSYWKATLLRQSSGTSAGTVTRRVSAVWRPEAKSSPPPLPVKVTAMARMNAGGAASGTPAGVRYVHVRRTAPSSAVENTGTGITRRALDC